MYKEYLVLIVVLFSFGSFPHDQDNQGITKARTRNFIYWENMNTEQQVEYLDTNEIDKNILALFEGKFRMNDDEVAYTLLDTLVSVNNSRDKNAAFYFFLFNRVCLNADGSMSEMLGAYCQKMLLNMPEYVICYLEQDRDILRAYAKILGYEFYFKEKGTSSVKYNYSEFKSMLCRRLNSKPEYDEVLRIFFGEIKSVIDKMN